jgi:hypothetical protein
MEHHKLMLLVYLKFPVVLLAAIIETLEQRVIEWPTAARKEAIKTLLQRSMVSKMPLE